MTEDQRTEIRRQTTEDRERMTDDTRLRQDWRGDDALMVNQGHVLWVASFSSRWYRQRAKAQGALVDDR
ncbi:MAG: hypothetical protein PVH99_13955 [Desulfobacteraceae bacterium]